MKVDGKKVFIPVTLTFETKEEFQLFWDGIEGVCELMRESGATFENDFYKLLVDISNGFTEL
jgi:hypothetical protein